ncbi:MAG: permease-like cell division protein FtsX [Lysobacteraceae bacterium]|uniref:permease-like cell division protein FtsX n=1 Tax=Denitratimonas sp. CY0512 TaxID=3131940 RepID=UPI0030B39C13
MSASGARPARNTPRPRDAGPGLGERLRAWRELHLYSLFSSIGRMMQRPWATVLTAGVMAIALVLPLCLVMLVDNLERLSGDFRQSREVSVFLVPQADAGAVETLAQRLRDDPQIESVLVRSPEEGLAEFRQMTDFSDALALLSENPLPAVLVVTPASQLEPLVLAQRLRALPEADFVQHDAQWRARLNAWLGFGRHLALVVAGLLGVGVLLVVGNTVRLDIQGRAEEIQTVQLLGATDGFVRRPFLYLGAWYGLFAAILALIVATLVPLALQPAVAGLVESYGAGFRLRGLGWGVAGITLLVSIALGWLGAWLAAGHHLRQTTPDAEAKA